jgi:hypothetical protein
MRLATNHASDASRNERAEREDGVPGVGEALPHYDLDGTRAFCEWVEDYRIQMSAPGCPSGTTRGNLEALAVFSSHNVLVIAFLTRRTCVSQWT